MGMEAAYIKDLDKTLNKIERRLKELVTLMEKIAVAMGTTVESQPGGDETDEDGEQ